MANDWIKMRPGMAGHAKVTAMSRVLLSHRGFREWFLGDEAEATPCGVTNTVTFSIVTRVTVAALLDVWGAVNHVVKGDNRVTFMALEDIDQIAGVPGFAEAMQAVEWVSVDDDGALIFPNFQEFNTPEAERKTAKTSAERKREQRERERAEKAARAGVTNVTPCHEMSRGEEKRREEDQLCPDAGARESEPPATDPEIEAAAEAHETSKPAPVTNSGELSFPEMTTVLNAYGVPHTFVIGKGRSFVTDWVAAGVTQADLATAFAKACQNKRDGPIGPAYLDPIVKQVVQERQTASSQRGNNHGQNSSRRRSQSATDRSREGAERYLRQRYGASA